MPPVDASSHWNLFVGLILIVSVVAPLSFGVPILGVYTAMDANFALQLVHGYAASIAAHHWFPRWIAAGNAGFGSPVFYYYGRLPFCVAGLVALGFHLSAASSLLVGIGLFRFLAFFTCRAWLRCHAEGAAADCGALLFISLPFAMSYNPVGRLGFAETAATGLIPLLFLVLALGGNTWSSAARDAALLAFLYAVLAATHLPQTLLAVAVATAYGAVLRGRLALFVNLTGAVCGLLLSAPNIFPALAMQRFISPLAWTGSATGDVRYQFLFTLSRFHLYHFLGQEVYLYSTWLLCLATLLPFALSRELRSGLRDRSTLAAAITLLMCLLGMTEVFWPVWVSIPQLRALQFPWRLFPASMALAASITARLVTCRRNRQAWCLALIAGMVAVQAAVAGAGAFVSLSSSAIARSVPPVIALRLPLYVPPAQRDTPAYALQRSTVPEYIPAAARMAGWHLDGNQRFLLQGEGVHSDLQAPASMRETRSPDGAIDLSGTLAQPASFLLPTFFFPDEEVSGSPASSALTLDQRSGFTRITVPAGPVALRIDHEAATPSVGVSHVVSLAGLALLLGLLGLSAAPRASRRLAMKGTS